MIPVYGFFGGRTTMFALIFTIIGSILAFLGKLNGAEFVALVGAVQTLVVCHSAKEDWFESKNPSPDK